MADNRIRTPATKIDFDQDVGLTGQDHDDFPAPGQARFDHMRMFLIGLLAHQSSLLEELPSQARTGSIWFPTDTGVFHYTPDDGQSWSSLAEAIGLIVDTTGDERLSLAQWFAETQPILDGLRLKATWSGSSNNNGVKSIPVPPDLQQKISVVVGDVRPIVYIEGLLVDPRNVRFDGLVDVVELLNDVEMKRGDRFTVIVEKFDEFVIDEIVASK